MSANPQVLIANIERCTVASTSSNCIRKESGLAPSLAYVKKALQLYCRNMSTPHEPGDVYNRGYKREELLRSEDDDSFTKGQLAALEPQCRS